MVPSTLAGRRIVITRPEPDADRLAERLRALGATPVVVPAIRIEFTDPPELDDALARIAGYDWVIFTSRNGVEAVFRRTRSIAGPRVAAIGPATAQALREHGVESDLMPDEYVAEAVLDALGDVAGCRCLLPRADIAREALATGLAARGAVVHEIAAYRTRPITEPRADLGPVDAVTFTSSSTVRGFLAGGPVPGGARIVCIGPITARTARECGLAVSTVAEAYTEDGLIAALQAAFTHP
jgi:uroporphyrinogen III methyltransferase / synthase